MLNKKFLWLASALVILSSCGGCKKAMSKSQSDNEGSAFSRAVQDKVFFGFDKSAVSHESKVTLDQQAEWIKAHPEHNNYKVEGNCDERGTTEYNLALGERRANEVKKYLVSKGVEGSKIQTVSYGKEQPLVDGHDEAAWAQNRRARTVMEAK